MVFSWPGNVRQLENMIKQVVVRGEESIIVDLLSAANEQLKGNEILPSVSPLSLDNSNEDEPETYCLKKRIGKTIAREEKKLITEVLNKTNWNRRKASDLLEISYRSLLYKIKDYNLNSSQ